MTQENREDGRSPTRRSGAIHRCFSEETKLFSDADENTNDTIPTYVDSVNDESESDDETQASNDGSLCY
jgi:hypothetical protein